MDTTVDGTLVTTQAQQDFTVHVKAYLVDYTDVKTYTSKVIRVVAATCDCSALAWDDATISTPSIGVNIGSTETLPLPVANTAARATNAAFDHCYQSSNDCATTGSFQAGSVKYDDGVTAGGTTLPGWISFSSSGSSVQTVVISPPDGTYNGQHTLFATYTTDNGPDHTYTALTFTVTCTLTSYTMPSTPAEPTFDLSYIVYADPMIIDLSTLSYTENPTCNYAITTAITWTGIDTSFMTQDANNLSYIAVSTSDKTKASGSPYTLTYQRTLTVTSAGQTGTTVFLDQAGDILTFQVTVTDPCVDATFTDPTLTSMTVQNGGTSTSTFTEATDSVDATYPVDGLCGDRDYGVYDSNTGTPTAISWVSVTKDSPSIDTHTITADPRDTALVVGSAVTYYLKIEWADYPSNTAHYTAFTLQVTAADCDCELLTWDNPSRTDVTVNIGVGSASTVAIPTATANAASKTASQDIITCYVSGSCSETLTNALLLDTGAALSTAGFITVNGDQTSIDVYPTAPAHYGTWLIMVTQDTASGANPNFEAVQITVGCTITDVASPTAPSSAGGWTLTYDVYGDALGIDLSTIDYPQTPLCGFTVTESFAWTIPSGAPITVDADNAEKVLVQTTNDVKHGTYTLTLTNTITHSDGTWTPSMTFDVQVNDPCRTTAINTVDVTAGMTLELGDTATLDFLEAVDAVEVSTEIAAICGTKSYVVVDPNNGDAAVSWISIAAKAGVSGTYTITASPTDESFLGTQSYNLYTTLDDYDDEHSHPGRTDTLTVVVQAATCDCSGVVRDQPSVVTHNGAVADGGTSVAIPQATINQSNSEALGPKIRACYSSGSCSNAATYAVTLNDNSNLPSFMVSDGTNIQITPTDGLEVDTYTLRITMTPTFGAVETYDSLIVVITCTISDIVDVAAPTTGLEYILYDTTHNIDLSGN